MRKSLTLLSLCLPLLADEPRLTFDNQPLGTLDRPLVLRSYLPDPGLGEAVFPQHDTSRKVSKYNPGIDNKITKASVTAWETLFSQYGCAACHSIDGSKSHGPSVGKLAGQKVELEGAGPPVIADTAYLILCTQSLAKPE